MAKDKNLHFESYEEAGEWFDNHDMAVYENRLIPADVDFEEGGSHDWVELDREVAGLVRKLAQKQHVSTRTLVNDFLREKIESLG